MAGVTGDAGPWSYQLNNPTTIAFDPFGYLYVLDQSNNRVQKWWPGASYGTTAIAATMSNPYGMAMDRAGNMYIADSAYHRVLTFELMCRKFSLISLHVNIILYFSTKYNDNNTATK